MGLKWFCDGTGKEVFLTPKAQPMRDTDGTPLYTTVKVQDATGKIITKSVPKARYLQPKGHLIRLCIGDENIQRVLSDEALEPLKAKLQELWDILEKMG